MFKLLFGTLIYLILATMCGILVAHMPMTGIITFVVITSIWAFILNKYLLKFLDH